MKRGLLVLMTLAVSLSLTTVALAAKTTTPPKYVCFQDSYDLYVYSLAIKLTGTITTPNGPVKYYAINGTVDWGSELTGSGHMVGTHFIFTLTGTGYWGGELYTMLISGDLNLAAASNPVGTCVFRFIVDGIGTERPADLSKVACP